MEAAQCSRQLNVLEWHRRFRHVHLGYCWPPRFSGGSRCSHEQEEYRNRLNYHRFSRCSPSSWLTARLPGDECGENVQVQDFWQNPGLVKLGLLSLDRISLTAAKRISEDISENFCSRVEETAHEISIRNVVTHVAMTHTSIESVEVIAWSWLCRRWLADFDRKTGYVSCIQHKNNHNNWHGTSLSLLPFIGSTFAANSRSAFTELTFGPCDEYHLQVQVPRWLNCGLYNFSRSNICLQEL